MLAESERSALALCKQVLCILVFPLSFTKTKAQQAFLNKLATLEQTEK